MPPRCPLRSGWPPTSPGKTASPDLIGPPVTTAASKLGVELADRYHQAGDNLDDLGRLIVSDYGKLTAVASKVDAQPGPGETDWRLGNVRPGPRRAHPSRQADDLRAPGAARLPGDVRPRRQISNARDWYCDGGIWLQQAPLRRPGRRRAVRRAVPGNAMESTHRRSRRARDGQPPRAPASPASPPRSPTCCSSRSPTAGSGSTSSSSTRRATGSGGSPRIPRRSSANGDTLHEYPYPDLNQFLDATR